MLHELPDRERSDLRTTTWDTAAYRVLGAFLQSRNNFQSQLVKFVARM